MEKTYKSGRARASFDAGSPLLLTPYIEENRLEEGRKAAFVDPAYMLPGIDSYAGYLTVRFIRDLALNIIITYVFIEAISSLQFEN